MKRSKESVLKRRDKRLKLRDFRALYESSPNDRIELIRAGVGAIELKAFAADLGIPQDRFFRMFGIAQATVTRKANARPITWSRSRGRRWCRACSR
ncbi:antitoxin Xre-like helix-turn-helix domain-containing protein [Massilia terrae]|uniref:antitoxin Xre-like helix-turn-helix domain-containing protein n=1 Tax=Massilia terrae TaxID=1811224 RepID=UPI00351D2873